MSAADPVIAEVHRCKAAWEQYSAACEDEPLDDIAEGEAANQWREAFDDLLAVRPTTQQGAVALIDQFLSSELDGCMDQADAVALIENLRGYLQAV
jgi:hypothetical protein